MTDHSSLSTEEMGAIIEGYVEGDCLVFAFALHWMCGWPVLGVSETGSGDFLHFAAQGHDGRAWDALGPRSFEEAASAYVEKPCWERVDPYRFVTTSRDIDETAITDACRHAQAILGDALAPHIIRRPH